MAPPALSEEIKEVIRQNLTKKPCVKCGNEAHLLINCPGGTIALLGSVWLALENAQGPLAENYRLKLRSEFIQEQNKAKKLAASRPPTAPVRVEPIIASRKYFPPLKLQAMHQMIRLLPSTSLHYRASTP